MPPVIREDPFGTLLVWGRLAAAHTRKNAFCIQQHRQNLIQRGECEKRVDQIQFWRVPEIFSETERAAISLSEAISNFNTTDEMEGLISQAMKYLKAEEIQQISTSVLAVNEWIDIHGRDPVRVLVVEDDLNDQELLTRVLKRNSIADRVLFVTNPRIALDLIQNPEFEDFRNELIAIMLDLHLPHMTGIELLRIIRSMDAWKDFPVIVMTSDNHPDNIAACKELNVMAFVNKPVTMDSFARNLAPLFHRPLKQVDDPKATR